MPMSIDVDDSNQANLADQSSQAWEEDHHARACFLSKPHLATTMVHPGTSANQHSDHHSNATATRLFDPERPAPKDHKDDLL